MKFTFFFFKTVTVQTTAILLICIFYTGVSVLDVCLAVFAIHLKYVVSETTLSTAQLGTILSVWALPSCQEFEEEDGRIVSGSLSVNHDCLA